MNNRYKKFMVEAENYANPPIPENYKHICGEWSNGFTIERLSDTSQFVWIPVGFLYSDGFFDNENFFTKLGRRNFRDNIFSDDAYNEPLEGELLKQYESVKKYGGFYFSRFNISEGSNERPQSVKGVMPWLNINYEDAKKVAASIENTETLKSHLPFGAEYDSVLAWFIKSKVKTLKEIAEDSTEWGNYIKIFQRVIFETGYQEEWCVNNIYDLAGNINEWTQERYKKSYYAIRGGNAFNKGYNTPVAYRGFAKPNQLFIDTGFRASLYIK